MNVGVVIAIVFVGLIIVGGGVGILISRARNERAGSRQRKSKYSGTSRKDVSSDSGAACTGGDGGGGHSCGGHSCGGHGCGGHGCGI